MVANTPPRDNNPEGFGSVLLWFGEHKDRNPRSVPSPDFNHRLWEWAERLTERCERSVSLRSQEADLRADLDPVIRAALSDLYQYDLPQFGTEVDTLPRGQSRKPADNLYGSVLVELKWNMGNALREKGSEQALDNLEKLENTTSAEGRLTAVVCDGRQWGFLIERNPSALLAKPLRHSEHFEWRRNSVEATRRFLQICGDRWRIPLTGSALVKVFDGNADPTRAFIAILSVLLDSRQPDDRPDTLFREWSRSTEVAYGSLSAVPAKEHTELRQQFGIPRRQCQPPTGDLVRCAYLFCVRGSGCRY